MYDVVRRAEGWPREVEQWVDVPASAADGDCVPYFPARRDLNQISIRHLLQHRAGWCDKSCRVFRGCSPAPFNYSRAPVQLAAGRYKLGSGATPGARFNLRPIDLLRFTFLTSELPEEDGSQSLPWTNRSNGWRTPPTNVEYSNLGYAVAGRVVEGAEGSVYFWRLQQRVLNPLGLTTVRLATTAMEDRNDDEPRYFNGPGVGESACEGVKEDDLTTLSVSSGRLPLPYGGAKDFASMESLGGLVGSAADITRLAMEISLGTRVRRRVLLPDRGERSPDRWLWQPDLVPGSQDGTWSAGRSDFLDALFLKIDRNGPGRPVGNEEVLPRWHDGLWNGTRGCMYVFPAAPPRVGPGGDTAYGTTPTIVYDPAPFGATFAELRNLNPPTSSDLYSWIRDLLTPGLSTTAFATARPAWLALFTAAGGGSTDADGLGVSDWGLPFEEIDP
jgi:CubicO group peptidase (beta-lactamase class C family)